VVPRGATRYRPESSTRRLTGVARHSPVDRPRTRSSRLPITLTPRRVRRRTTRLKTFLVNQEGTVYEKDLGEDTASAITMIEEFNPDSSWNPVAEPTS